MMPCKVCSAETEAVISFGAMPISNHFLTNLATEEYTYSLELLFCPKCFMVQLGETVPPDKMFHGDYHFISSTSDFMKRHFEKNAAHIKDLIQKKTKPFVVELGCNDGIMLQHLAKSKIKHLGIEPSGNVAALAQEKGVSVLNDFFNHKSATAILDKHGAADIICGSNVMCHIEALNSVFEGVNVLLADEGTLFFEDPYLLDIVKKTSFDQIYDEHVFYFSGLSIQALAAHHGLELFDMERQDVHGGSMRYYVGRKGAHPISKDVSECLSQEKALHLDELSGYESFSNKVKIISEALREKLVAIKAEGHRVVGYGATSKSTTLLTFSKIDTQLIDYISDITPNKINKFTPGTHIPVKSHQVFDQDDADYALLLAWNHKEEIMAKEKAFRNRGGKFITFFPEITID